MNGQLSYDCIPIITSGHAVDHAAEVETDTLDEGQALDFYMGQEHGQCHNHLFEVIMVVSAIAGWPRVSIISTISR